MTQPSDGNVAARLRIVASLAPGAIAIAEPNGPPRPDGSRSYALTTFGISTSAAKRSPGGWSTGASAPACGWRCWCRSGQFIELVFALLKAGVVGVLIDPGMGRKHLIRCLSEAEPDGFVGIPKAQAIRTSAATVSQSEVERDGRPAMVLGRKNAGSDSRADERRKPIELPQRRAVATRRRSSSPPAAPVRPKGCCTRTGPFTPKSTGFASGTTFTAALATWPAFRCLVCLMR